MSDFGGSFNMQQLHEALNLDSALSPQDRRKLDDALELAAEERIKTHPCAFRMWSFGRAILQAAQWQQMSAPEVERYKRAILDFCQHALTIQNGQTVQDCAGLQACKIVEHMARGCMQYNDTHLHFADVQMLTSRNIVPLMSAHRHNSQEISACIAWVYERVSQQRHAQQW